MRRFALVGRTALVTGGAKGLGFACAQAFAEAGADVAILGREAHAVESAANALRSTAVGAVFGYPADVTDPNAIQGVVRDLLARTDHVDILLNNAGVASRMGILDISQVEWDRVFATNVSGAATCARAVVPGMLARRAGRIINVASTLGLVGVANRLAYVASKSALIGFTRSLALELAPHGITVNAICPGPFLTPMNDPLLKDEEAYRWFESRVPLGRLARPEEIGGAAIFLASDAASFVTGSALMVDGGWTAQ